jgi:hypothetical protein
MKRYKILTIAMSAAVLGGASAMAQFNYQNGDLIVAFGNGGTTDVVVDMGALSNFQQPGATANSWNLSSVLGSVFGSVNSGIYWAAFGVNNTTLSPSNPSVVQASPYTVWSSLARMDPNTPNLTPSVSGNANSQHLAANQIETIANLTSPGMASPGQIVDYALGIELVSTSLGGFSPLMNSSSDPGAGNLGGTWANNMLNYGQGTSDFYQNDPGNPLTTSATPLGTIALSPTGVLTFNPVPEPSTWAMIGSGFLTLLALRRRK